MPQKANSQPGSVTWKWVTNKKGDGGQTYGLFIPVYENFGIVRLDRPYPQTLFLYLLVTPFSQQELFESHMGKEELAILDVGEEMLPLILSIIGYEGKYNPRYEDRRIEHSDTSPSGLVLPYEIYRAGIPDNGLSFQRLESIRR